MTEFWFLTGSLFGRYLALIGAVLLGNSFNFPTESQAAGVYGASFLFVLGFVIETLHKSSTTES